MSLIFLLIVAKSGGFGSNDSVANKIIVLDYTFI
jgi:hypothetical protein